MTFLWTETLTPLAYQLRRWHTSGHASGHAHAHCPLPIPMLVSLATQPNARLQPGPPT